MIEFLKNNTKTIVIAFIFVLLFIAIGLFSFRYFLKKNKTRNDTIRSMIVISIFGALSVLFYLTFKFSLPIFPSFLKINFSNLFIIIISLLLGPIEGIVTVLVRTIVVLPFTETACVGELADLMISFCLALVSGTIYNKKRTKNGAILSLCFNSLTWIVISIVSNILFLVPAYITLFFNGDTQGFISMLGIIPNVTIDNYMWKYILIGVLPFNVILSSIVNFITFIVYKKLSVIFHKFDK